MQYAKPLGYFGIEKANPRLISRNNFTMRVWELTISNNDRSALNTTFFHAFGPVNKSAKTLLHTIYSDMQPGNRPCVIELSISNPLSADQAKTVNDKNAKIMTTLGKGAGGTAATIATLFSPYLTIPAGYSVNSWTDKKLLSKRRTLHEGDVIIHAVGRVSGGIGPCKTIRSIVLNRSNYDVNEFRVD